MLIPIHVPSNQFLLECCSSTVMYNPSFSRKRDDSSWDPIQLEFTKLKKTAYKFPGYVKTVYNFITEWNLLTLLQLNIMVFTLSPGLSELISKMIGELNDIVWNPYVLFLTNSGEMLKCQVAGCVQMLILCSNGKFHQIANQAVCYQYLERF